MAYCTKCGTQLTMISENTAKCRNCGARFNVKPRTNQVPYKVPYNANMPGTQNVSVQNTVPVQNIPRNKPEKFQHLGCLISGIILVILSFGTTTPLIILSPNAPMWARVLDGFWRLLYFLKFVMGVLTVVFICQSNGRGRSPEDKQDKYVKACENNNVGWACCGAGILICIVVTSAAAFSGLSGSAWEEPKAPGFLTDIEEKIASPATGLPSMEEADVEAYFGDIEDSEAMTVLYDNMDGASKLSEIEENASSKFMASWVKVGDSACKLTGQYNGVWYYGWGTKDKILVAYGSDKDLIYNTMKGYGEKYKEE